MANRHRPTHEYPLPDASVRNGLAEVRLPARALWHSTVNVWFGGKSEMSKLISGQPGEKVHDPTPLGSTRFGPLRTLKTRGSGGGTVTDWNPVQDDQPAAECARTRSW